MYGRRTSSDSQKIVAPTSTAGGWAIAFLVCGKHDGDAGIARFGEIRVLRHVLLFVGSDRPDAEVVDLLINVVAHCAGVVASLRLQNTDGLALSLGRTAICVDGLNVFVVENDSRRILCVVGRVGLVGLDRPVGQRLILIEDASRTRRWATTAKSAAT